MRLLFTLFIIFYSLSYASDTPMQKVSLRLVWLNQFQFAGYYMAKEKGFYKDVHLDLTLKKFNQDIDTLEEVIDGNTTYSLGNSSLISKDSLGEKITLLNATFQSSPNILLVLESSGIKKIEDFKNKTMMQTDALLQSAYIKGILSAKGLSLDDIIQLKHSTNLNDLIDKKVDIYSAYLSNEPYILREKKIPYRVFYPKEGGLNFYSDILFTSQKYFQTHKKSVKDFNDASLKGWKYAFSHINESVDLILRKYNTQGKSRKALIFEANELKKLAYFGTKKLGLITREKIERIYDVYCILGLAKNKLDINRLLFNNSGIHFSAKEREYLEKKPYITYCTQPNSLPYSAIENSHFIGIGANLLKTISDTSHITFELIESKTWVKSLQKVKKRECDIIPLIVSTPSRKKYLNFTHAYYEEPLVLITRKNENYIMNMKSIVDNKFAILKGNGFIEYLKQKYPKMQLFEVTSMKEGLDGVESKKYYAYIDILMSAAYTLQKSSRIELRIANVLDMSANVSFGIRNDDPILLGIFEKIAKNLTQEDIQIILNRWVSVNYPHKSNKEYIQWILIFVVFVIVLALYREYFLKKKNRELEALQDKLVDLNFTLESRIRAATHDLEEAQKVAKMGFWVYDIVEDTLKWSKYTYTLFEVTQKEDENLYEILFESVHPDDREKVQDAYYGSLQTRSIYTVEHRIVMADGSIKYISERGETRFLEDGTPIITYGTSQDISQKVLAQMELEKKDAFLKHQSRLAQMGEMLSMIAHQWKQPLSAISSTQIMIKTTLELEKYDLSKEDEKEEFVKFLQSRLDKIALYVQNLSNTIKDFSDFYKPNKLPKDVAVDTLLLKAYDLIKDSLSGNMIGVSFDLNAKNEITLHENEFLQVLLNVMQNAKDQLMHQKVDGARVYIRSYEEEEYIYIEIEDNAGGIEEELLEKIFDPYFSTKADKNGTGLGLYMSKMIIDEYHHGSISAKNAQDGALFTIKIKK